ncbi:Protein alcS [Exophiala dermatitidis]
MASGTRYTTSDPDIVEEKPNLSHTMSAGAISITPEMFEKLYLTPKVPHVGDNIKRFANPTPMGFVGFVISTMTFAMIMMGWGGAEGLSPVVGIFFFVGPLLLVLTTIFEWIMGNFFSMMVCGLFSVFWLSFGMLQLPTLGLAAPYSASGTDAVSGAATKEFNAVVALYLIVWGFALLTFFIFTLKTNIVLTLIFLFVTMACWVLSGAYWKVSKGDYAKAHTLQVTGGALLFIVGCLGWYMTFVMMAAEVRMAITLPVGDLSHFWPKTDIEMGRAEKPA